MRPPFFRPATWLATEMLRLLSKRVVWCESESRDSDGISAPGVASQGNFLFQTRCPESAIGL